MADDSKTEKATPKKRSDERKKGHVPLSRDAMAVATLVGAFFVLRMLAGSFAEQLEAFMAFCMTNVATRAGESLDEGMLNELIFQGLTVVVKTVGPITLTTVVCAVAATLAQTRFLVSTEPLKPKFSKINPIEGVKRLFSLKSLIETLKNLLKIALLMIVVFISIRDMFLECARYLYADLGAAASHLVDTVANMVMRVIVVFVAIAAFDFFYQRWDYERNLRMSKQEIKEEYKQTEGDPQVKGKIKEIQRSRARQRMMQQVPQADVVIRNPTHYAVALRYKPEQDSAPIVLAKGQDSLALRIVQIAEENHVAVMENVPLARALYADAELNQEIPPALYGAVAEVLVYIFRLNDQKKLTKQ